MSWPSNLGVALKHVRVAQKSSSLKWEWTALLRWTRFYHRYRFRRAKGEVVTRRQSRILSSLQTAIFRTFWFRSKLEATPTPGAFFMSMVVLYRAELLKPDKASQSTKRCRNFIVQIELGIPQRNMEARKYSRISKTAAGTIDDSIVLNRCPSRRE